MGWLAGYSYRKSITASRASGAVTNYQMKIAVGESSGSSSYDVHCAGHALSTFNDIRFTTSDGTTLLDYWIEDTATTGTTPNQTFTIWVEFDSIGTAATTFYMYYGNSGAAAYSNGGNTFQLFDHFTTLDTTTVWTNSGTFTQSGSTVLKNANNTNTVYGVISKSTYTAPLAIESRCKVGTDWVNGYSWAFAVSFDSAWASAGYMAGHYKDGSSDYTRVYKFGTGATNNGTNESIVADTYYRYSLRVGSTNQFAFVNDTQKGTIAVAIQTNPNNVFLATGRPGGAGPQGWYTTYFDWFAVRNYIDTEPTFGSWGNEEASSLRLIFATGIGGSANKLIFTGTGSSNKIIIS